MIALVIEGGSQDWRDSIVALAKLYHSAVKLGMNAQKTFEEAANLADPGIIKTEMNGFPLRPPRDRDLKAFHITEEITEDSFDYKQGIPWLLPQGTAQESPTRSVETPQQISSRLNRNRTMR